MPIRVKGHVSWPRTGRYRRERHRVRDERTTGIKVPDVDLVGAEVDAEHVIAIEVRQDLMCVRPLLTVRVGSGPVADALEVVRQRADRSVVEDPKHLKVPAGIAGRE